MAEELLDQDILHAIHVGYEMKALFEKLLSSENLLIISIAETIYQELKDCFNFEKEEAQ